MAPVSPARGEVWWYDEPGKEPRPFVILTRPEAIAVLDKLVGVPSTQTVRGIQTEVELGPQDGMRGQCVLSTDNVTVIHKAHLRKRIATLGPAKLNEICHALDVAISCD